MRVSAVFRAAARCCNTANSSLTIDGKNDIMNKRIGSAQTGIVSASESRTALSQTVVPHAKKPFNMIMKLLKNKKFA